MITATQCFVRYGSPETEAYMTIWYPPEEIALPALPKKIYCNKELVTPLGDALRKLCNTGYSVELKTWDGCFNIRKKRGSVSRSLHSWGIAIDINAAWNPLGGKPTLSKGFVECFTSSGFDWGGVWTRPDGMHFQLAKFPKEV